MQIVTKEFIERFKALNNIVADVYIKHLLYGSQKIRRCVLRPLMDGVRIGLVINGEAIYIAVDELCGASIDSNKCVMKSEVMELRIML